MKAQTSVNTGKTSGSIIQTSFKTRSSHRDTEDRDSAVRDILSLEMVTRFEAEESPVLPDTQEAAIRCQNRSYYT